MSNAGLHLHDRRHGLDTTSTYRRVRDVRFRRLGEEAVVLRQESAEVLVLNEVGGRILELVEGGHDAGRIVTVLTEEFDVAPEELERDVAAFLSELCESGVLERVEPPPR
jgi:hypothetical protein